MMHELEKSGPSTVAVKPVNNSEGSEAESVERREGAEGNTGETRTRRTPSRESVFPGLERVRKRARQQKKERFTALLRIPPKVDSDSRPSWTVPESRRRQPPILLRYPR